MKRTCKLQQSALSSVGTCEVWFWRELEYCKKWIVGRIEWRQAGTAVRLQTGAVSTSGRHSPRLSRLLWS